MADAVRIGIIGGGLMGRETASALGRWFALAEPPVPAELVAVCDVSEPAREWFRRVPTVRHITGDLDEFLKLELDVAYVAVPHNLHEEIYLRVLEAGMDLFAEKPFGIDLRAALMLQAAAAGEERFVRVSSEMPFFPGAQRVYQLAQSGAYGRLLEVRAGFWHSSDIDPAKPANWKRQSATCGEAGVMGDLGMHVRHIPLRLGWTPRSVFAQLQKGYPMRPSPEGPIACDTWDNAMLHCEIEDGVPMRLEMKRMAPGETNTWYIEVLGTEGGARFSTKEPKTLWTFTRAEQGWTKVDLGFATPFKTVTGGIFEPGFPDVILQMWAAFLAERAGVLGEKFGCVTVREAVTSHQVFAAALESQRTKRAIEV